MSHPAMWPDLNLLWQTVTDVHLWLLAGWLGFSLLVAWVVGGEGR